MVQATVPLAVITLIILKSGVTRAEYSNILNLFQNNSSPNFLSLASEQGFQALQHDVVTEDGYILKLFHIPGKSRFPVFLLHGILFASDVWVIRGATSLAITLANQGYDVWCGNSRGNRYSRRHVRLDPDEDDKFWRFSFHEVGFYDVPAFIDKILHETGASKLTAFGHSQGTTAFYVLGATRPEYNDKVNLFVNLSPVAFFRYSVPPLSNIFEISPLINMIMTRLNLQEIVSGRNPVTRTYQLVCPTPVIGYACLVTLVFPITGYDAEEVEPSFYSTTVTTFPAGTSSRSIMHYLQLGHRKIFAQYDNGADENKVVYNSTIPPPYDLSKVTMPMAFIVGKNDLLSIIPDVIALRDQLPNVVYYVESPREQFNHLDNVWGRRMRVYLFPYIFEVLQRYNGVD